MKTTGILIDTEQRTITEVPYHGDWRLIARCIQCEPSPFTIVRFGEDTLYVDDEGLLKKPQHFFMVNGYPGLLAGRGLFLGETAGGDVWHLRWATVEMLVQNVAFFSKGREPGTWSARHAKGFDSMTAFIRARASLGRLI
jgi:hypothetical protein